jgi:hypothetical protein
MNKLFPFIITVLFVLSCTSGKPEAITGKKVSEAASGDISGALQQTGPASAATLEITPGEAVRNTILNLNAKGFNLPEAEIVWLVNDTIADDSSSLQFRSTDVVRGDAVQAKAVLKDQTILSNIIKIGNTPPKTTSVKLLPEVFKPGDTLNVSAAGTDADGDPVSFIYEWTKNGAPAGNTNNLASPVQRGDSLSITITPFDGREYGSPVVIEREIRNMPPVIVEHKEFSFDGSVYTYQVRASDPDGDTLAYSLQSPPEGMMIDPSSGLLKWVVPKEFKGKKNVVVAASDGRGGTATYAIEITIQ